MMIKKNNMPTEISELRNRAEEIISKNEDKSETLLSREETKRVLHELRVHQLELEMQNEELQTSYSELEAANTRYFDLYEMAPVAYCTISKKGLILDANLTTSIMLDVPRGSLPTQYLERFIFKEDHDIYYMHMKQLFETQKGQTLEVRMVKKDGTVFWAHLETTGVIDLTGTDIGARKNTDGSKVCRVVLSDITEQKLKEAILKERMDELQRFQELVVGRELVMIELKKEVNTLLKKSGQEEKYRIVES